MLQAAPLPLRDATVDHVVCHSRGGSNALENLVLACAACNHRRADLPADVWLERCTRLGLAVDTAVAAALRRAQREHRHRRRRAAVAWLEADAA